MNKLSIRKKNEMSKKKKKGFTLVELIIVIAIIAILAAMAIPKFSAVRIDAKVSNDVATAKNIQTQIATLVSNQDTNITVPTATATAVPDVVLQRLDGKASKGATEALNGGKFNYTVDKNENIVVLAGTYQLYPDDDKATNKAAYVTAVKAQK